MSDDYEIARLDKLTESFIKLQRDFGMLLKHFELAFEDIPEKRVVKSTAKKKATKL